jgi:hypothetical protein
MTAPGGGEGTTETLDRARAELARQLGDACDQATDGELPETTGELLRLEDSLLAAARATEHMIAVRRKTRGDREVGQTPEDRVAADSLEGIREFRDRNGVEWRAWSVIPGRASAKVQRHLGEMRSGWLAFETLDGKSRRRLVPFPSHWMSATDEELQRLLEKAADAPVRRRSSDEEKLPPPS